MKTIIPGPDIYLVQREPFPETKGRVITLTKEDRSDHLYLGKVLAIGAREISAWEGDDATKIGDYILYVASAGWKLQNCPHAAVMKVGDADLVLLKEDDIVAVVGFKGA